MKTRSTSVYNSVIYLSNFLQHLKSDEPTSRFFSVAFLFCQTADLCFWKTWCWIFSHKMQNSEACNTISETVFLLL